METIQRSNSSDTTFVKLVAKLDAELAERDGEDHSFYNQFNKIDSIKYAVIFYYEKTAVACGAIKKYDATSMEVKRMYTLLEYRGLGLASKVLKELELWAKELGFTKCILETGIRQPEAIALYKKNNYTIIDNYGQYIGVDNSVCFEKVL
ncbi:GNAT family N-acetyltransferase [Aurantibacter crassamenti]|uniref:GNAT family N-acetyltransferase n=1 Tax=Aurantibacter crassamenti TaxID=1837375 RepID=UPI001939C4B0|nr:GNAT family N-acetyltransferase [Aurantibacter crassamenti]MBM1106180.1 GNAT family N-acetyltransferase [Aurantibacter crassamenti]